MLCPDLYHIHRSEGASVDWTIVGINFLYALLGVLLMYLSYRAIDMLTPQVDFPEELKRGNVAVAIFIGALFVSIALIVGGALN
jgi:uncharacterized membrane protein YjfL (UPF0719 family)